MIPTAAAAAIHIPPIATIIPIRTTKTIKELRAAFAFTAKD